MTNQNGDSRCARLVERAVQYSLLINSLPYSYFGSLAIGSPPVSYNVILDTGSAYVCSTLQIAFEYSNLTTPSATFGWPARTVRLVATSPHSTHPLPPPSKTSQRHSASHMGREKRLDSLRRMWCRWLVSKFRTRFLRFATRSHRVC